MDVGHAFGWAWLAALSLYAATIVCVTLVFVVGIIVAV